MRPSVLLALGLPFLLVGAACSSISRPNGTGTAKQRGYDRGEIVTISGVATDIANQPVAELEVVLRASRQSFDYLRFRKRRPVVREVATTTSAEGEFEIEWPWDKGFNRFTLLFGVSVAEPGGEEFQVLHREDLSRRIEHGSPVASSVQIQDTSYLDSFLEFRAGLESEAQRKVYREV